MADRKNDRVQVFDSAGRFEATIGLRSAEHDGLTEPQTIAVSTSGEAYVAESGTMGSRYGGFGNNQVKVFDARGLLLVSWGNFGRRQGQLQHLGGIAVNRAGNVYVADIGNHRVQVFDDIGRFLQQWGGEGADAGQFNMPSGIAADPAGRIYVADTGNHRVQVFDAAGRWLGAFGSEGIGAGQLKEPSSIGLDSSGNVYVADTGNHRIQVFSPVE